MFLSNSLAKFFQPAAGGKNNRVLDAVAKTFVALPWLDEFDGFRSCCDADGFVRLTVREHVIVFTGSRTITPQVLDFGERVAFFQSTSHQSCHWSTVPLTFAAASHFPQRDLLRIHPADAANEGRIADVCKRNLTFGFDDESRRGILKTNRGHIVEDSAVIQLAILRR